MEATVEFGRLPMFPLQSPFLPGACMGHSLSGRTQLRT